MSDVKRGVTDLAAAVKDDRTQWQAVSKVINLSDRHFDPDSVKILIRALANEVEGRPRYNRTWNALRNLAELYPLAVADSMEEILAVTPANDQEAVGHLGRILWELEVSEAPIPDNIDRTYLRSLKEAEPDKARMSAATLHARYKTSRDVKALEEMASYEIGQVAEHVNKVLDRIGAAAVRRLQEEPDGDQAEEFAVILQRIAHTEPGRLVNYLDDLVELLGTEHGDVAATSLAKVAECRTCDGVVRRLVDTVRVDTSQPVEGRTQLEAAESALRALGQVGELDLCDDYLIKQADQWLDSDDALLREHALTQLRLLTRRAPETIDEHLDHISEAASEGESLASDIMRQYARSQTDGQLSFVKQMLEEWSHQSAVGYLANAGNSLQYRPIGETSHCSFSLSESLDLALQNVGDTIETGQTFPVVWPEYEPRVVTLVAIELALRQLREDSDVVVFSPGGQNHWGNKGELRNELSRYGIAEKQNPVPLPDVVPHANISDGDIKIKSDGWADTRIVLTKRLEELRELESPDTVLLNLTCRTKGGYEEEIDELVDEFESTTFVPVYSTYTKHEFDERRVPRYGPPRDVADSDTGTLPGVAPLETAIEGREQLDNDFFACFEPWIETAIEPHDVHIVGVSDGGVMQYLETGYEASAKLREFDEDRAAGQIFSRQLMFERLPVPTGKYDDWVRSQPDGYFTARTIRALISRLEEEADDVLGRAGVAQNILHTARALERAYEAIERENPLYDELTTRLERSLEAGDRVAVFLPKSTWRRAVESILVDDGVISEADVESGRIRLVDPDSARGLDRRDRLYVVGPQRPQYAGFYLHPQVYETVVVTYRGQWDWMVKRDTRRFVELQNDAAPGIDYEPYSEPEITVELSDELTEEAPTGTPAGAVSEHDEGGPAEAASVSSEGPSEAVDRQDIAELFDQSREVDYSGRDSDRYDDHKRNDFLIETVGGETVTRRDRVLRRRDSPSADKSRYHWLSPRDVRQGDEIVLFDEDELQGRWKAWLTDVYDDELEGTTTIEDLEIWYDSLTGILEDIANSAGTEDLTDSRVRERVTGRTSHIDREQVTVWNWFQSVAEADYPLELAQDSSLTIGPRRPADIAAVGEEFDIHELQENASRIGGSMGRIRGTNSREGHKFREDLKEQMNSLEDDDLRNRTAVHEVAHVTEV